MKDFTGKIANSETEGFEREGFSGQVYVPTEAKLGFNALLVTVGGRHPRKEMLDAVRNYYVVEGSGTFTIDDTKHEASPGDLFVVEPGHTYEYEGEMKLFEFNISPDNSFKDKALE